MRLSPIYAIALAATLVAGVASAQVQATQVPAGAVVGNLITAGSDARVDGRVESDVITAGGDAWVRGVVDGDVISAGGNVRIEGRVEGDVLTDGGAVALAPGARVDGDILTSGGAVALGQGAQVDGDVLSETGPVSLADGARVDGQVDGGSTDLSSSTSSTQIRHHMDEGPSLLSRVGAFCLMLLLVLGFRAAAPVRFAEARAAVVTQPMRDGLVGLGVIAAFIVATLGLAVTVVGIPVAFVSGTALAAGTTLGAALTGSVLGAALPIAAWSDDAHDAKRIAAGIAVLFALSWIPWFGALTLAAASAIGVGALFRTRPRKAAATPAGPYRTV